jgi:alcohol dehydrogenase (cytochrome c)
MKSSIEGAGAIGTLFRDCGAGRTSPSVLCFRNFAAGVSRGKASLVTAAIVAMAAGVATASPQSSAGPFTAEQVAAGKQAYEVRCMACHQPDLSGQGDALPLAGAGFMLAWGGRSTAELYKRIHDTMPYGFGRSLPEATYADIVAYVLSFNGARPGSAPLTANTAGVKISALTEADAAAKRLTSAGGTPQPPMHADASTLSGHAREVQSQTPPASSLTVPGDIRNYTDVTDEMLSDPSDADWIMYRGGYRGWSYSKLDQINDRNVGQLQLAWSWAMVHGGTLETTPLIHDGILFLWNPGNVVQAFEAETGNLLWENRIGPDPQRAFGAGSDANRTIAIYRNKVFITTREARMYALDARTGKVAWQTHVGDPSLKFGETTAGPIVINGKVISGLTSCGAAGSPANAKAHCYISAYDAETGKRVWQFHTVALTGKPGGDTWNNVPDNKRAGGETWILGTYDTQLNTTYWGTAQAKPWRRDLRGTGDGSTLYTTNTLALNPDTGELKWHFSHQPGETLDLDEVFERVLIDEGEKKILLTIGKPGILWKLDRVTGKFIASVPTVVNNVSKVDRKTGVPSIRPDIEEQKLEDWLASCPGPQGGHDWQTTSYHQPTNTLVIPLSQSCVLMLANGSQKLYPMPGSDGMLGRLSAFDASTLEPKWTFQQRSSFLSSVLTTAGNLAFVGDFDRNFRAVDVRTGHTLWKTRLGTTVQGHPVTFSVKGKQYIAITAGLGGGSPQQKPMELLPEVVRPLQGNQLYVFALPETASGEELR